MIKPIGKRVIVEALEDKVSGVIEIPDQFKQMQTGRVVAVGGGISSVVEVGDTVLFHPNAAWTNIEHEGKILRVMAEDYLLAVMEGSG